MAEHRFIPNLALTRHEIVERLGALGFRRVTDEPRTHLDNRTMTWEHASGARVAYQEHHIVGDRYLIADGKLPAGFNAALEPVHRLVLLRQVEAAPGLAEAMVGLRRLCLLERDAPSPELRAWLDRAFASPDLFVRQAAATAALFLERSYALEILAGLAANEPHRGLRAKFARTLAANRKGTQTGVHKPSTRATGPGKAPKTSSATRQQPSATGQQPSAAGQQ
ncbi:MAG: hypothetical protein EOO75_07945, partial [Myxococcales bacterium]